GVGEHRADVVDLLEVASEAAAAHPLEVLHVAGEDLVALLGIVDVRGGAPVDLMERTLAEDRDEGDVGGRPEPLVELEVAEPATGHGERFVEAADLLEQAARGEQAVA